MEDLRITRTKKTIKESFISLVEEKGYAKVTIKDISERAMINRNTFYLHYFDKIDLVNKLIAESFLEQKEKIVQLGIKFTFIDSSTIRSLVIDLLNVFYDEIEFYRILLTDSNLSGHLVKLEKELEKACIDLLSLDYSKYHLIIDYIFFGMIGIIKQWIVKDNAKIEEIADLICDVGLSELQKCFFDKR